MLRHSELTQAVLQARADEVSARTKAQRLELEAQAATREWQRTKLVRERAELWARADSLRAELEQVTAAAEAIRMPAEAQL
jgi:predicted  nucleic acid-binding Zn-ribbon protein